MNSSQGSRFRTLVVALLLFFGFAALVLLLNVQQVASLPRDARFQALLAAVPIPEVRETLQHQAISPLRSRDQFAAAAEQWRDRAVRIDAAVVALARARPAETESLARAWAALEPTLATLAAPAPESFDEIWPDGSRAPNPAAQPYRKQFADAVAAAEPSVRQLATALATASAAAETATQNRITRLQYFNAAALAIEVLLLAFLIFHVVRNFGTSAVTDVSEQVRLHADLEEAPAGAPEAVVEASSATMQQLALHLPAGVGIVTPAPVASVPDPSFEATQQISTVPPLVAPEPRDAARNSAWAMTETVSALAARIGSDLGREIRVEVRGLDLLPAALTTQIREILLQLVRNAAVHGIENPAERAASGKPSAGCIQIEVAADPQALKWHLNVEDDGRGLSRERLRTAAVRKGMLTQEQAAEIDGIKLIALLFRPGFSTCEEVTAHAGRGVGMNIVRTAVEELGGRIGVATKPRRFTRFKISLPMDVADEAVA
jgi:signal transduction histidine kinase